MSGAPKAASKYQEACLNDCGNFTGHGSGYCEPCRTFHCPKCNKDYVATVIRGRTRERTCAACNKYQLYSRDRS